MAKGFNEQQCRNIQLTFNQSTSNSDCEFSIVKIGKIVQQPEETLVDANVSRFHQFKHVLNYSLLNIVLIRTAK